MSLPTRVDLAVIAIYAGACLVSFLIATFLIRRGIPKLRGAGDLPDSSPGNPLFDVRSTGFWIGFCETILIFFLAVQGEYGALAIVVGAKEVVRKNEIMENASYYLLGTLVNLTVALTFAQFATVVTATP